MPAALKLRPPDARAFERCPRCGRTQTRTTLQNARLWVLYQRIAERREVVDVIDATTKCKRKFSARAWHEYYKRSFLGLVDIELPSGQVVTRARSTRSLDVAEFADYMTKVEADAADAGVYLDE